MTLDEYKSLPVKKARSPAKPKAQTPKQQMDISSSEQEEALGAITINKKADYVEYSSKYIEYRVKGQLWRVRPEKVN